MKALAQAEVHRLQVIDEAEKAAQDELQAYWDARMVAEAEDVRQRNEVAQRMIDELRESALRREAEEREAEVDRLSVIRRPRTPYRPRYDEL
jgi:hypothetical protein